MTTKTIQIQKPQLIGSEKQINWANDIIDIIIAAIGEINIPENATEEQIKQVKDVVESFFSENRSWQWIEYCKHFTSQTPKKTIWARVKEGWPKF